MGDRDGSISPQFIVTPVIRTYVRRSRSKSSGGKSDSEGARSESEARSDAEEIDRSSLTVTPIVLPEFQIDPICQDDERIRLEDSSSLGNKMEMDEKIVVDKASGEPEELAFIADVSCLEEDLSQQMEEGPTDISAVEEKFFFEIEEISVSADVKSPADNNEVSMLVEDSPIIDAKAESIGLSDKEVTREEVEVTATPSIDNTGEMIETPILEEIKKKITKRKPREPSVGSEEGDLAQPPTPLRRTSRIIKKAEPRAIEYSKRKEQKKGDLVTKATLKQFGTKPRGKLDKKRSKSDPNLVLTGEMSHPENESTAPLLRSIHKTVGKFRYLASSDDAESSSGSPSIDFEKHVADALKGLNMGDGGQSENPFKVHAHQPGISRSAPATPVPGKVKSRWRRSSELESSHASDSDSTPVYGSPKHAVSYERLPLTEEEEVELRRRLKEFDQIETNMFLSKKSVSKERMHCDCTMSKEEIANDEKGCLEDCLNRLLMIECDPDCALGSHCMNKRFQERMNANIEVFKTSKKGFGLRALEDLESGTFLMEYVGEVINLKQFERRKKIYAKDSSTHYYFMALKSDSIIDATLKGNISRFINHSCDPNSETQKWTVNGELRIGFFTKLDVKAGEELTFDYQYERYGKEAQRCYCDSENCRGWIGEVPSDEEDYESDISLEDLPPPRKAPREPSPTPADDSEVLPISSTFIEKIEVQEPEKVEEKKGVEMEEVSDEEEFLEMQVECKEVEMEVVDVKEREEKEKGKRKRRMRISRIFQEEDDLDFQIAMLLKSGLKNKTQTLTFCRLMVRAERLESKRSLLSLLAEDRSDPACRRLLLDYHGLKLLGCWLVDQSTSDEMKLEVLRAVESLPIPNRTMIKDSKVYSLVEKWANGEDAAELDKKQSSDTGTPSESGSPSGAPEPSEIRSEMRMLSKLLLDSWSALKEVFRIPKRERIEAMKEHEREADRNEPKLDPRSWTNTRSYDNRNDRWTPHDRYEREYRRRDHLSPDWRRKEYADRDSLSKDERRQRFMLQVQREEEETRKRKRREEVARNHEAQCKALGIDSSAVPLFIDPATGEPVTQPPPPPDPGVDPSSLTYYIDPLTGQWTVYMPEHMQLPPGYDSSTIGRFSYDSNTGMMIESNTGYQLDPTQPLGIAEFLMANYPVKHMDYDSNEENYPAGTLIFNLESGDMQIIHEKPNEVIPEAEVNSDPKANEVKLPPKWSSAVDASGRTYYYHIKNRIPQWSPPEIPVDADSDSDESETDSDEGEDSQMEVDRTGSSNATPPPRSHLANDKAVRRDRRRGLLVKEFLISPRDENEAKNPYLNKESAHAHRKQLIKEKMLKKGLADEKDKEKAEKVREKIRKEKEKLKAKYKATLKKLSNAEKKIKDKKIKQKVKMEELAKKKALQSEALRNRIKEKLESSVYGLGDKKESMDEESSDIKDVNLEIESQESQQSSALVIDEIGEKSENVKEEVVTEASEVIVETVVDPPMLDTSEMPGAVVETEAETEQTELPKVEEEETKEEGIETEDNGKHGHKNKKEKEKIPVLDFDTDKGRKIKEDFRKIVSNVVVSTLNPFFKADAKYARITSNDDFKHLARKFTHFVMQKEMKHCKTIEEYICSESMKQKAKDFIRKYMKKFGPVYKKGLDEDLKI